MTQNKVSKFITHILASKISNIIPKLLCSRSKLDGVDLRFRFRELETLHQIAREVKKSEWNCLDDPCTKRKEGTCWNSKDEKNYTNIVNCTCYDGVLHISDIYWRKQNLTGVLPISLTKLPYLKTLDLSKNVLSGTMPREWGDSPDMKLEYLSLFANRLSGPIPKNLGNIVTLTQLSIESNRISGSVPAELGNLVNLINLAVAFGVEESVQSHHTSFK